MTAVSTFLLNDNSTYASFSSWAGSISAQLAAAGWVQSTDTGQVMWSGMTITAVSMSGTTATYTYSALTGFALAVGRALTITGLVNPVNNGVKIITGVTPATSTTGTFTVTNASGITESGSSGVVTAQSTVPTTNNYVYDIWTPNDGLTNFYLKMEYGNYGNSNAPAIGATLSTTTNGAGVSTGYTTNRLSGGAGSAYPTAASTTVPYECKFSGGAGYFGALLWRGINNGQMVYVERSVNSSGIYVSNHVTLCTVGFANTGNTTTASQQTLMLGTQGAAPQWAQPTGDVTNASGFSIRAQSNLAATMSFNGSVGFDTLSPYIGYFDYPLLGLGAMSRLSVPDDQLVTLSIYGNNHQYYCTQTFPFSQTLAGSCSAHPISLCMRFE